MLKPYVACSVENCTHNMKGQCMASKISVYNEETSGISSSHEDTQCQSFKARNTVGDMIGAFHNSNITGTIAAYVNTDTKITPEVECFVTKCRFWETGNSCNAGQIHITGESARKEADTDCATFEAK